MTSLIEKIVLAIVILLISILTVLVGMQLSPAYGDEYYNLKDLTTDPYRYENEGLHPPYLQGKELPDILPLECGIERVVPLNTYLGSKEKANGTTWYYFDTNLDGIFDVTMSLATGDENRHPVLYYFDRDYVQGENGPSPEIGYVDVLRTGECKLGADGNIRIYWVPEQPKNKIGEADCVRGDCDSRQEGDL